MFVQRSEFNSGKRIALYKNYLLLILSLSNSLKGRSLKFCVSITSVDICAFEAVFEILFKLYAAWELNCTFWCQVVLLSTDILRL